MPEKLPDLKNLKSWNKDVEEPITKSWKESEMFAFNKGTKKKIYSIDTPPPYVNAPIHIGQATTYCYMDFFARFKRMKGFEVIFPLGLDRNGLPIEMAAEKKFNVSPFKVGREKFIEYCKEILKETSSETEDTFAKLGISFTSYKQSKDIGSVYLTDSPEYREITQSTFIELYKKGLVYEDSRINNWDPKLQTTVADSEIERKEQETDLNYVKFKLTDSKKDIIIATTRPELLCTSALVIYNPKDKRYKDLKGKKAITPIFDNEVEIIEHEDADPNFGTGIVFMSSSGGDQDAVRFLRKLGIKPVSAINKEGKMNEKAGILEGLKVKEAREKIIEEIKSNNLMEKQEKLLHSVPIAERSKAEIEFIEMPEIYLKQIEFKKDIKKIAKEINFFPKSSKKILDDWLEAISIDWPISRRRYYATPIPIWHSNDLIALPPAGKYYTPWEEDPPENSEIYKSGKKVGSLKDFPKESWTGETRVFDTWMDSSISELVILKHLKDQEFFKKVYPCSLRPQGKEIIRTWLYYTILRGFLETGKPCFEDVWINQHIVDKQGKKMAKSVGNVIDPQKLLKEFGAEAIRFWAATEGDLAKQDLKCSEEKIRGETKTLTKLLNISKFILNFEKPKTMKYSELTNLDKTFIEAIEELTEFCETAYENYDFFKPATRLRRFLWDKFASHYLELVKSRAYNESKTFTEKESNSAKHTLYYILERLLVLLYPIIPQATSTIGKALKLDLHTYEFPKTKITSSPTLEIKSLMNFNSKVWKKKRDSEISLRDPISKIEIPKDLKKYENDLKSCHNLN